MLFDEREKLREAGEEFRICSASILLAGERAGRTNFFSQDSRRDSGGTVPISAFDALVEAFMKARCVNVKAEDLRGEGMLGG